MNKRGISHIEMLLSFLIFAGFVIFALYFFSPFNASRLIESSLTYAKIEMIKNTSVEIDKYSIKIDEQEFENAKSSGKEIIEIQLGDKIPVDESVKMYAENKDGSLIHSKREGTSDKIRMIIADLEESVLILKIGEDFSENVITGNNYEINENKYSVISSDKIKIISENRILGLKEAYEKDYEKVKKNFNLPSMSDFEFEVVFSEIDAIKAEKNLRPQSEEIFANSKRIEVLRTTGEIQFADLKVRV